MQECRAHGIANNRIQITQWVPWQYHTTFKGAADLVLDTFVKNGHTTTADALWAGVPVISIYGERMSQRWAGSLLVAFDVMELVTYSFREYEDLAVYLAKERMILKNLRRKVMYNRWTHAPFQTIQYVLHYMCICYESGVV